LIHLSIQIPVSLELKDYGNDGTPLIGVPIHHRFCIGQTLLGATKGNGLAIIAHKLPALPGEIGSVTLSGLPM
jgi:hypothetical protein